MFCPICGAEISSAAQFCPRCGASTSEQSGVALGAAQNPYATTTTRSSAQKINTYLIPNILAAIFCCRLLGIIGVVYSILASNAVKAGDFANAQNKAQSAKTLFWASLILGLIAIIIVVVANIANNGNMPTQ